MRASLAAVLFALSAVASAQTLLWEHASPNGAVTPDISYGYFLLMPGDLNFDGVSDVLVSNSASPNGAQANAGYVGILSGVDGSPIYELHGVGGGLFWNPALNCFGLAPGDIDGDGARDFWIRYAAAPFTNPVEQLVSGATGTVIPNPPPWANPWYFPVGDLNGDFIDDLVSVNYYLTAYAGPAYTQQLWSTPPPVANPPCSVGPNGFRSMVPMGDVNGDGVVDLLAGSTGRCFKFCVAGPGSASVVSGATGAILQQWTGSSLCDYFGLRVASPGDLDGDGIPDAVVDVPGVSEVRVFSTASGTQLASYPAAGTGTYQPLTGLVALEDVDGDGFREFALQGVDAAHVQVISVATGTVLYTVNPPSGLPYPMLGESLVTPGDVNGDGIPEVALGVRPGAMPGPSGVVRMYSLAPAGVSTFGSACPQSNGKLARIGAPHAAHSLQHFTVNLSAVPPNQGSVAMFGLSNTVFGATGLPWNLASYGMPACSLFTSIDLFYCMQTTQIRPGEGAAAFTAVIPPGLAGVPFYAQWGVLNPVGAPAQAAVSRALAVTIQ